MVNGQGNGERTTPACGLRCRAANFAVPNGLNGVTMPTARRRWRHAGRVRSQKPRENAQNAWRQCLGISEQPAWNHGNASGISGNWAGIFGKSAAIHGGVLGITGQVGGIRGSGLGFDGNPPGFGGSVRHGAAMAGKCPQAVRIARRDSGSSARGAGNLRPHSGRRFRDWGNGRGRCRQHGDMVRQARPCVPGEILSTDATELFTNTTMTARKKIRITILGKYFA